MNYYYYRYSKTDAKTTRAEQLLHGHGADVLNALQRAILSEHLDVRTTSALETLYRRLGEPARN